MSTDTTALARKFQVDVTSDLTLATGFAELVAIYDLKPQVDPNLVDTSAYDTDGWDSFEITGNAWSVSASFWRRKNAGVYPATQELVRACVGKFGDAARVGVRWFERDGGPECFQGVAIVKWERAQTGVKDADGATVTLTGDGVLTPISNPGTAATAPIVTSATPSGAATGDQVTIYGASFTGATAVKFGAVSVTEYVVVSDGVIVAVMPTGSAGAAAITVTNSVGTSAAFGYTRG